MHTRYSECQYHMIKKMDEVVLSISILLALLLSISPSSQQRTKTSPIHILCAVPGHDYLNLTLLEWYVNLEEPNCLPMLGSNHSEQIPKCTLSMSFCSPLLNEQAKDLCYKSSVCQKSPSGQISFGAYNENPFTTQVSHDGFQAVFTKGTNYQTRSNSSCQLQTLIDFHCNHSVLWKAPSPYKGMIKAPDPLQVEYDADTCQVKLTFDFAGACKWKKAQSASVMSPGSVLLLIFFISLSVYFIIGCLVNIAKGKSGFEIIPHLEFWSMLPVFIIDGMKFVICCGRRPMRAVVYEEIKQ